METNDEIRAKDILPHKTVFSEGDGFYGDGDSSFFMEAPKLLELTAQIALAGNVAPAFDPTRTSENPYKAGESVAYDGKTYTFKVDHYGAWSASDVLLTGFNGREYVKNVKTKALYLWHENTAYSGESFVHNDNVVSSGIFDVNEGDYIECDGVNRWHAVWYYNGSIWQFTENTGYIVGSGVTKVCVIYKTNADYNLGVGLDCELWIKRNSVADKISSRNIAGAPKITYPNYIACAVKNLYHDKTKIDYYNQKVVDGSNDANQVSSGLISVNDGDYFECDPVNRWNVIWFFDGSRWEFSKNTSYTVPPSVTKVMISYASGAVDNVGVGLNCIVRKVPSGLNVLGRYFPRDNFVPDTYFKASDVHWEHSKIQGGAIVDTDDPDRISSGPIKVSPGDYLCCDENYPWHGIWYFDPADNSWNFAKVNSYSVPEGVSHVYIAYKTSAADNRGVGLNAIIYCCANISGESNPLWNQLPSDKLSFGLAKSSSPIPYPKYHSEFIHGMLLVKNMGAGFNRWGFHLIEGWNRTGTARFTALVDKHNTDVNGKASFEMYFYTGSNHFASSYGNVRVGSDVQNHSFAFDRDTLTAFGQVDLKSVLTCARISPSTDLITCASVADADSTYEPENDSINNAKCLLYLALHNAQNGAIFYDTDRDKLVAKIAGKWCDLSFTDASSNYDF